MKKWTKKIIISVVFILLMGGATGCGEAENLTAWRTDVAQSGIEARFAVSKSVTDRLYQDGYITEDMHNGIMNLTDTSLKQAKADAEKEDFGGLLKAVVAVSGLGRDAANGGTPYDYRIQFDEDVVKDKHLTRRSWTMGELSELLHDGIDDSNEWDDGDDPGWRETQTDLSQADNMGDYWNVLNYYIPGNLIASKINGMNIGDSEAFDTWHAVDDMVADPDDEYKTRKLVDNSLKVMPYNENLYDELNEMLSFDVYVLKPDQDAGMDLDNVIDAVNKALGGKDVYGTEDYDTVNSILGMYFVAACDKNGKSVKLIDTEKCPVLAPSKQRFSGENDGTGVGYNLVLGDNGVDQIEMQCYDYNKDFLDALDALGAHDGKFLLVHGEGVNRAYLMEYPVYCINGFIYDEDIPTYAGENNKGKEYRVSLLESKISVNIMTKKIVKYDTTESGGRTDYCYRQNDAVATHMSDDIAQYLTVGGTYIDPKDNTNYSTSSFMICGRASARLNLEGLTTNTAASSASGDFQIVSGRIVLRDYLELAFAPDCAAYDEDITAFGRKLRFNFDTSNSVPPHSNNAEGFKLSAAQNSAFPQRDLIVGRDDEIISFVDFNGIPLVQNTASKSVKLTIKDLADANDLSGNGESSENIVTVIANRNEAEGENVTRPSITSSGDRLKVTDLEKRSIQGANATNSDWNVIYPTMMFPGPYIDKADYNNETANTQLMYGMTVRSSLTDTALYSGWITSQDPQASMIGWNDFLSANALSYQVDANEVDDYVMGSYISELQEEGIIILDLNVIAKIERDMARDSTTMRNRWIQTSIYVLAWGLIIYAVLLLTAWTFDVNADFGFKLTEKLTLGNWVACADKSELPVRSSSTVQYVTLPRLLMSCFGIAALGVLLLSVSAFNLVYFLIDVFGAFAQKVETIIRGI